MKKHPELLAPAGSPEAVRAAVCNGADAVYLGFGTFNARRGAKNFTVEQMQEALAYCRLHGVKTNLTVNTLISDRELPQLLDDVRCMLEAGADALIVQDLGAARAIKERFPDAVLHASTQMTVHSLEGARFAAEQGFSRVVLSRELPKEDIAAITRNAGIETEVFVHGALCMCYSGQCGLSAVIGRRSGNRGLCAQPCRLPYDGKNNYPMSLKDNCLLAQLRELCEMGVASLKIEGRMKRPEYVAIVTGIYSAVLRENRAPTAQELEELRRVFSRDGFTQGYYQGTCGPSMFGMRTETPAAELKPLYDRAARTYDENKEKQTVPVCFSLTAKAGQPLTLTAAAETDAVTVSGDVPEKALRRAAGEEDIVRALRKTGGTVFCTEEIAVELEDGLSIPARSLNALRREALEQLTQKRMQLPALREQQLPEREKPAKQRPFLGYTVQARTMEQIPAGMEQLPLRTIYLPAKEIAAHSARAEEILRAGKELVPVLPRILWDGEQEQAWETLRTCQKLGCTAALVGNVGQIAPVKRLGMTVYGDFGLNAFHSKTLRVLRDCGVERQTLSFELRFAQIRDMNKPMETELIAAGRLPLMLTENCMMVGKNGGCRRNGQGKCADGAYYLTDRMGKKFPVFREEHCRNTLYNSQPLALEPKEYQGLGISYARILLTDETPQTALQRVRELCADQMPDYGGDATRGLYRRGVE
jgi:putative protease